VRGKCEYPKLYLRTSPDEKRLFTENYSLAVILGEEGLSAIIGKGLRAAKEPIRTLATAAVTPEVGPLAPVIGWGVEHRVNQLADQFDPPPQKDQFDPTSKEPAPPVRR
jgi:hypothetical protein